MIDIKDLQKKIQRTLSPQRFHHMLKVAELCRRLARRHGWDADLAYRTGFLHDCTKEWSPARLKAYVRKKKIAVPDRAFIEKYSPNVLHGFVGARWAREQGWLTNPAALRAIACHTLGRPDMNKSDMILFIADFASKDRKYKTAYKVRRVAQHNLRAGYRLALAKKIRWNLTANKPIHPYSLKVWNALVS